MSTQPNIKLLKDFVYVNSGSLIKVTVDLNFSININIFVY